jgi:predicted phosphodiesterase
LKIAIFADIHGKILLPFKLVDLYQKTTGEKIDFILQCGDIGAYPNIENLDKATLKHAQNDPDEMGFHEHFTNINTTIELFLNDLGIDMICVRGNHEDHDFLDQLEQSSSNSLFAIDAYNRVLICKTAHIQTLKKGTEELTFVGIGRIGDRKGRIESRFLQNHEKEAIKTLSKTDKMIDILISHDQSSSNEADYGMLELHQLLQKVIFQYHFHGHTGQPFSEEIDANGLTNVIKIKELEFESTGILPENCMIILEKAADDKINFKTVSQQLTNQIDKYNWNFL